MKQSELNDEYKLFLAASSQEIPEAVSVATKSKILKLLNPSLSLVINKMTGIHLIVGFVSLLFCHQFGMNPFQTEYSLANWMMTAGGHAVCMVGCGVFFMSSSLGGAIAVLSREEFFVLQRSRWLTLSTLSLASILIFALFGANLVLSEVVLWIIGAFGGGALMFFVVRRQQQSALIY
jgi:hypothetical protein